MAMSSLPQGWHGVTGSYKTSSSISVGLSGSSVPVTIRRKWNSPQASNVSQTKLPSYKSSNLKKQNCNLNNTYEIKTPMTTSNQQTKLPVPTKPSPVKEYKNEIEKLKKELSTVKAENSILKAKVRRVDDENVQKGRQIEKLRVEIKALQKNESANSRKGKESQELLLLRQKCLRLEGALKEKDFAIKKLTNESSTEKKEDSVTLKEQLPNPSKNIQKEPGAAKSSLSRASLSIKNEVTKLRDMIHKLEKENKDLQHQAKLHCLEIRKLKLQLKSKEKPATSLSSASKSSRTESTKISQSKPISTTLNAQSTSQTKTNIQNSSVPKQRLSKSVSSPLQKSVKISPKQSVSQKPPVQKNVLKSGKVSNLPNGNIVNQKQVKNIQSRLPSRQPPSAVTVSNPAVVKSSSKQLVISSKKKGSDLELKIQEIRENIAAKKIQRTWRHHQKCIHQSTKSELQNEGKALTFIISSLKHHKLRKTKLNHFMKKKMNVSLTKKDSFIEAIQSVAKTVWNGNENYS